MRTIEAEQAKDPVEISVGEEVAVRLSEHATSGFRWSVESVTGPLKVVSSDFVPPPGGAAGAGGLRTIVVRGESHGRAELHVRAARSWAGAASGGTKLTVTFTVV